MGDFLVVVVITRGCGLGCVAAELLTKLLRAALGGDRLLALELDFIGESCDERMGDLQLLLLLIATRDLDVIVDAAEMLLPCWPAKLRAAAAAAYRLATVPLGRSLGATAAA